MKQEAFVQQHQQQWDGYRQQLDSNTVDANFPANYRRLCQHLAIARQRHYSPNLINQLDHLVLEGHSHLYGRKPTLWWQALDFIANGFPRLLREQWRYVLLGHLLLYVPFLIMYLLVSDRPELIYSIVDHSSVEQLESSYNPANDAFDNRTASDDVLMFGHYIKNNIGIGFTTFGMGLLGGIGSALLLIFNGLFFGAAWAHILSLGYETPFFTFIIAHGAFELTAIALCGSAGMILGVNLIHPGNRSRALAMRESAEVAVRITGGAATMLLVAAVVEAFWSPRLLDPSIKYTVGALCWVLVYGYFWIGGRGSASPKASQQEDRA